VHIGHPTLLRHNVIGHIEIHGSSIKGVCMESFEYSSHEVVFLGTHVIDWNVRILIHRDCCCPCCSL
jgi:hypothetical protein